MTPHKRKKKPTKLEPLIENTVLHGGSEGASTLANLVVALVGGQKVAVENLKTQGGRTVGIREWSSPSKKSVLSTLASSNRSMLSRDEFLFDGNNVSNHLNNSNTNDDDLKYRNMKAMSGTIMSSSSSINSSTNTKLCSTSSISLKKKIVDLQPQYMFPSKNDVLSGALFTNDKSVDSNIMFEQVDLQYQKDDIEKSRLDSLYSRDDNDLRPDGTMNGMDLINPFTDEEKKGEYYRWVNKITSTEIPKQKKSKSFVLVEESRIKSLTDFEETMRREGQQISFSFNKNVESRSNLLHNETPHLSSVIEKPVDELKESEMRLISTKTCEMNETSLLSLTSTKQWQSSPSEHKDVINTSMLDPRVPTTKIAKALKSMSNKQFNILLIEWNKLQSNWIEHVKQNNFNTKHLFHEFTEAKLKSATKEEDGEKNWLLRNAPVHEKQKKLKSAKAAYDSFLRRQDHDTMLYEDDRSFLYNQMYEAKSVSMDYDRYVFLCGLFGPMSESDWKKCGSRPGQEYWVKATLATLKIQHCWDRYWSTYKLHRYRAARWIQTCWRCHYTWSHLYPLIRCRMKFGKRTYYFFVWDRWLNYNYTVKTIAKKLHFHKYNWPRKCFHSWKIYVDEITADKRAIFKRFQKRFDVRMNVFHRILIYALRSKKLKCVLRNMYYIPQYQMWVEYTKNSIRRKELGSVVTPVQAMFRKRLEMKHFAKMMKYKPIMLKFHHLIKARVEIKKQRNKLIDNSMIEWEPTELLRRASLKIESERRRQLREMQLADEKASNAINELQKHFKSWNTNGRLQIKEESWESYNHFVHNHDSGTSHIIEPMDKKEIEYNLLKRCYLINYELQKFEYRIKKGPHIVCADPLCNKFFSSDELYLEHVEEMMNLCKKFASKKISKSAVMVRVPNGSFKSKNTLKNKIKGVFKRDVAESVTHKALLSQGIKDPFEQRRRRKQALEAKREKTIASKQKKSHLVNSSHTSPESEEYDDGENDNSDSDNGNEEVIELSATEKFRLKREKEKERGAELEKIKVEEIARQEFEKEEKKRRKKEEKKRLKREAKKEGVDSAIKADIESKETAEEKIKREEEEELLLEMNKKEEDDKIALLEAESKLKEENEIKVAQGSLLLQQQQKENEMMIAKEIEEAENEEILASSQVFHKDIRNHMVFLYSNYAQFHLFLKDHIGLASLRSYLMRKHGNNSPILNTIDCWESIQLWRLGTIYGNNEPYITRAMAIYESYIRPDCQRPLQIKLSDGDVEIRPNSTAIDYNTNDSNENKKTSWWDVMCNRLMDCKNRDYVGFYGMKHARPSYLRMLFGVKGKQYQAWSDQRTIYPDTFDILEWVCFQSIFKQVHFFDNVTEMDQLREFEIDRLQREKDVADRMERNKILQRKKDAADEKVKRLAKEQIEVSKLISIQRLRELDDALEDSGVVAHITGVDLGNNTNPSMSEDPYGMIQETRINHIANAIVSALSPLRTGKGGKYCTSTFFFDGLLDEILTHLIEESQINMNQLENSSAENQDLDISKEEREKSSEKQNLFGIPWVAELISQLDMTKKFAHPKAHLPPFMRSREYEKYENACAEENSKMKQGIRDDFHQSKVNDIEIWTKEFIIVETDIARTAEEVTELIFQNEVNRLCEKANKVWQNELILEISEKEQIPIELNRALGDDAVAWVEENMLDHTFDHYVYALLNIMLTMPEMEEGLLEYGGFLKGKKQLKKKLEIKVQPIGYREDLTWFKSCLRDAIEDDLKHMPLDYIGCVKLIQCRIRGWLGRSKGRRQFAQLFLKKFDSTSNQTYYVFGGTDPPTVTWERPKFMLHLFPNTTW